MLGCVQNIQYITILLSASKFTSKFLLFCSVPDKSKFCQTFHAMAFWWACFNLNHQWLPSRAKVYGGYGFTLVFCLSVICLSESKISQKFIDGFGQNLVDKVRYVTLVKIQIRIWIRELFKWWVGLLVHRTKFSLVFTALQHTLPIVSLHPLSKCSPLIAL